MKKMLKQIFVAVAGVAMINSCSSSDDNNNASQFVELTGNLETQTLTKNRKYLLKGQVFVRSGKTLTIEPGTVIFGDKATKGTLIIDKGGKIIANGTANEPIVFTSVLGPGLRDRGDWGGLVILGNAYTNQNTGNTAATSPAIEGISPAVHFGSNTRDADDEDSGVLRYVRIEYAGIELTPNNETNSLTLGGVGRGTTIEYVQVSYGGDDGFEWFGGAVNGKYLISFGMWDDDFDADFGYSGNNQFGLAIRYPSFADQSGSNAFECDNGPNDTDTGANSYTTATFSNFTVIGPRLEYNQGISGNYQHSIDLRRRVAVSICNSVFVGFPRGLRMANASVYNQYTSSSPRGVLLNNRMVVALNAASTANSFIGGESGYTANDIRNYWLNSAQANTISEIVSTSPTANADYTAAINNLGLNSNIFFGNNLLEDYTIAPTFTIAASGSLNSGASFTNAKFSETNRAGFFTTTTYIGAFGTSVNWTSGWAEFRPGSKVY